MAALNETVLAGTGTGTSSILDIIPQEGSPKQLCTLNTDGSMLSIIPTVVSVDQIVQQQQSGTGQDGGGGAVSVTSLVMPAGAKATPTGGGTGATAIITTTTTSTATNTSNSGGGQNYRDISSSGRVMTGWTTFIIIILLPFSGGLGQLIER